VERVDGIEKMSKNCPICGIFMFIDMDEAMARGEIAYGCPRDCERGKRYIDEEATERLWDEIDYDRFQDDPRWLDFVYC
jgi:hypothetical protein